MDVILAVLWSMGIQVVLGLHLSASQPVETEIKLSMRFVMIIVTTVLDVLQVVQDLPQVMFVLTSIQIQVLVQGLVETELTILQFPLLILNFVMTGME